MDIEARKYHLIERVMSFDEKQLDLIELFLQQEAELSNFLEKSIEQVKNGQVVPHDEVRKKYEKWT